LTNQLIENLAGSRIYRVYPNSDNENRLHVLGRRSGSADQWGSSGDLPVIGDFDGDGRTDIVVYRPSTGNWFVLESSTSYTRWLTYQWGTTGDMPVLKGR
jgi:FG-GAP repeat